MRPPRLGRGSLILWVLFGLSRPAFAQSDQERSAARAAGELGLQAFSAGDWQKALVYLRKAQSIVDSPTHLLYIARAEAKLNHLVEAREAYIKLDRSALATNASDAFRQAKELEISELPAIEARLPHVTLFVTGGSATQLLVDQTELPVTAVGIPFPINPGEHVFQAKSASLASKPMRVSFPESVKKTLELHLSLARESGAAVESVGDHREPTATLTAASHQTSAPSGLNLGEAVPFTVGVLGVGTGVYFLIEWSSSSNEADQAYSQFVLNQCLTVASSDCRTQAAHVSSLDHDAARAGTLSTVGYVVGGLGLGTGLTMMLIRRGHENEPGTEHFQAYLGPQSAGVLGTF